MVMKNDDAVDVARILRNISVTTGYGSYFQLAARTIEDLVTDKGIMQQKYDILLEQLEDKNGQT